MWPSALIARTALLVGGIAFFAGFVGPIIVSNSNLGPLLGIFVTGPIGLLAGALVGIVLSARQPASGDLQNEIRWFRAIGLVALLVYLFAARIGGGIIVLPWVLLQIATVIVGGVLFVIGKSRPHIRVAGWRRHQLFLAAIAVMTVRAIIPPVKAWNAAPGALPWFVFFLDSRFDASQHVPMYTVDVGRLVLEWTTIAVLAMASQILRPTSDVCGGGGDDGRGSTGGGAVSSEILRDGSEIARASTGDQPPPQAHFKS